MANEEPKSPATVPLAVLSKLFNDLSERRIQQLVRAGHIPKPAIKGQYELGPCVRGYIAFLQRGGEGAKSDHNTRYERARADTAELRRDELKGLLVPGEQIEGGWNEIITLVRQRFLGLATKCAARWAMTRTPQDARAMLDEEIREILTELSNAEITIDPPPPSNAIDGRDDDDGGNEDVGTTEGPHDR